jgi:protein-tyrosine-phosphatase
MEVKMEINTEIKKKWALFVCTGNTCRSAMAEQLFRYAVKKSGRERLLGARSCGVFACAGDDMPENAKAALKNLGVSVKKHKAKPVTLPLIKKSDLIVCMTASHKAAIINMSKAAESKCRTVSELTGGDDVPDPYGGGAEVYLKTAEYLLYACGDIIKYFE